MCSLMGRMQARLRRVARVRAAERPPTKGAGAPDLFGGGGGAATECTTAPWVAGGASVEERTGGTGGVVFPPLSTGPATGVGLHWGSPFERGKLVVPAEIFPRRCDPSPHTWWW